jgi:hypothetical protein
VKTKLTYGTIDYEDYLYRHSEACIVADTLWAYGYEISDLDAYRAWLAGGDGLWEHPFDYSDNTIVEEVVSQCFMDPYVFEDEEDSSSGAPIPPSDLALELSGEEWDSILNSLEEDMEAYEAKYEPRVEGAAWVSKTDSANPLEKAIFN